MGWVRLLLMVNLFLLYKAEKPSVCLSVCIFPRHADNSVACASIETRPARNDCYVFWHQRACYLKFPEAIMFDSEALKTPMLAIIKTAGGSNTVEVTFFVNAVTFFLAL